MSMWFSVKCSIWVCKNLTVGSNKKRLIRNLRITWNVDVFIKTIKDIDMK